MKLGKKKGVANCCVWEFVTNRTLCPLNILSLDESNGFSLIFLSPQLLPSTVNYIYFNL